MTVHPSSANETSARGGDSSLLLSSTVGPAPENALLCPTAISETMGLERATTAQCAAAAAAAAAASPTATVTTVIRVKRRRDEAAPPPTLRIDGTSLSAQPPLPPSSSASGRVSTGGVGKGSKRRRRGGVCDGFGGGGGGKTYGRNENHNKEEEEEDVTTRLAWLLDRSTRFLGAAPPQSYDADAAAGRDASSETGAGDAVSTVGAENEATVTPPAAAVVTAEAVFRRIGTQDPRRHATKRKNNAVVRDKDEHDDTFFEDAAAAAASSVGGSVRVVDARLESLIRSSALASALASARSVGTNLVGGEEEGGTGEGDFGSRASKRPRLALTVVGSRTVSGDEFWGRGKEGVDGDKEQVSTAKSARGGGRTAARARMLRRAAEATAETGKSVAATPGKRRVAALSSSAGVVYDPLTRSIDSSLLSAPGCGSVVPHLSFLRNDPTIQSSVPTKFRSLLNHLASDGSGTVLHAAAILNDLDGADMALDMGADLAVRDGEGRTAEEVARLAGNENLADLFVARMGGGDDNDNDEDFVYDVYCLERPAGEDGEDGEEKKDCEGKRGVSHGEMDDSHCPVPDIPENDQSGTSAGTLETAGSTTRDAPPDAGRVVRNLTTSAVSAIAERGNIVDGGRERVDQRHHDAVELRNGFGYWNSAGELVLEAAHDLVVGEDDDICDSDGGGMDDDEDSNSEGYAGNDYPEDGAYGLGVDSDLEEEEEEREGAYFDQYPGGRHSPNAFFGEESGCFDLPRAYCQTRPNAWNEYMKEDGDDDSSDEGDGDGEFRHRPAAVSSLGNLSRLAASGGSGTGFGSLWEEDGDGDDYRGPMVGLADGSGGFGWGKDESRQFAYDDELENYE